AVSAARREAVPYRPSASWFEGARLQCPAPLDDRMIEQFECQAKSRQFLFLDGVGIVAFERFADDDVDLALHRQQFLIGFHGVHPGNHSQDSPTARSSGLSATFFVVGYEEPTLKSHSGRNTTALDPAPKCVARRPVAVIAHDLGVILISFSRRLLSAHSDENPCQSICRRLG